MKLCLVVLLCVGCSNASPIEVKEASIDNDASDVVSEQPVIVVDTLCCDQDGWLETCGEANWGCSLGSESDLTYDCTTPICAAGQYCIGTDGPGMVVRCEVRYK